MESFRFYQPIETRYGDLDPQGHVNAARYMTFVEQARIAYLHHLALWTGGSFLQGVRVGTRITRLGAKSLDMIHHIEDAEHGRVLAFSKTVLVTYNYHADRASMIPDEWREKIAVFEQLAV